MVNEHLLKALCLPVCSICLGNVTGRFIYKSEGLGGGGKQCFIRKSQGLGKSDFYT